MLHTAAKVIATLAVLSGPIMLASGLGFMDCPAMLCKAKGGTGIDKMEWAAVEAKKLGNEGVTASMVLIYVGTCKVLAFVDVWIVKSMPRITLLCVAIMMAAVTYGHSQFDDDLPPPIVLGVAALLAAASWPSPAKQESKDKKK